MSVRICDDRGDRGFSWVVEEKLTRTSHALADGGRVWLVDPVDDAVALERATTLGEPQAVLQLLDRHNRDSAAIAARLGIPRLVAPRALPGTPFEVVEVKRRPWWREVALWWAAERTLIVPEAVGTNRFYTADRGSAGVHVFMRLFPPRRALARFEPEHLLVCHGEGVHGSEAAGALRFALADSRRGIPRLLRLLPSLSR
ncbi:MAG: hypothetical protein FJW96_11935 [Actinobacteria bacterium]|nr:hypothetical protein [Actinomycetota bacterium]